MAKEAGLDLGQIAGSGPHGRIVKADVEKAKTAPKPAPAAAPAPAEAAKPAPAAAPAVGPAYVEVANSSMRKVIAVGWGEARHPALLPDHRLRHRGTAEAAQRAERPLAGG
ncbi:MAG: E3 binding domain-containing protein [Rhodospirillales bacterium]